MSDTVPTEVSFSSRGVDVRKVGLKLSENISRILIH